MYTNGLKDRYGKLLNCGVDSTKVTNDSSYINLTATVSNDTILDIAVEDNPKKDVEIKEDIIKGNIFYKQYQGTSKYNITDTSKDLFLVRDIHEKCGIMMAACANGIIKSINGVDWKQTSLTLPCESICSIGGDSWVAGGYPKQSSGVSDYVLDNPASWISNDNGVTWNKLQFFKNNKLTPIAIATMPHAEYKNVPSHDCVLFGCRDNGGLWVRYYDTKTGTHKYYNPDIFKKGYVSVLSICHHKSSGWTFVGLDKPVNMHTVWMTKDCSKWYPVYSTTGQVENVNVIDSEDNSYIFISDSAITGYVWNDMKSLEFALHLHYRQIYNLDENGSADGGSVGGEAFDMNKKILNLAWNSSKNSTFIENLNEGGVWGTDNYIIKDSAVIRYSDGTEGLAVVHEKGIGIINSNTPNTETIIHSYHVYSNPNDTTSELVYVGAPFRIEVNQNGELSVGHIFRHFIAYFPSQVWAANQGYNTDNVTDGHVWCGNTNNYRNAEFGIDCISIPNTHYKLHPEYYKATESTLHIHSAKGNSVVSSNECVVKKLNSNGDAKTMVEKESTYLLNSDSYTSQNNGSWLSNTTSGLWQGFGGMVTGAPLTTGDVQMLPAYNSNGDETTGTFNGYYFGSEITQWAIGLMITSADNTLRNVYSNNIENHIGRWNLGINVRNGMATISYNGDTILHDTGIVWQPNQRLVFAYYRGYAFLANAVTHECIKVNTSGLNTLLKVGGSSARFWTNGGINQFSNVDNQIIDLTAIKSATPEFDVLESVSTYNWVIKSNFENSISRSIIGEKYTSTLTNNQISGGFTNYNDIVFNPNNKCWYTSLTFQNTSSTQVSPCGIYKSSNDGVNFSLINDQVKAHHMKYLKNEIIIITEDANGGGSSTYLLSDNDVLTSLSLTNIKHALYIPQIDAVITSNGYGNLVPENASFKVYHYSDFIAGNTSNAKDIMIDADLSKYLPSDFYLLNGKSGLSYVYCCFQDTVLGTYDICRLSVDKLEAVLNGEDTKNSDFISFDAVDFVFDNFDIPEETLEHETKIKYVWGGTDHVDVTLTSTVGISSSEWEEICTDTSHGWKENEAVVLNDVFEGNAFYCTSGNAIHKTGAYSGKTGTLVLGGETNFGSINKLCSNNDANTLYVCATNGLFHVDVNSTYTTGGDSLRRVQNILSKLGIEEQ